MNPSVLKTPSWQKKTQSNTIDDTNIYENYDHESEIFKNLKTLFITTQEKYHVETFNCMDTDWYCFEAQF